MDSVVWTDVILTVVLIAFGWTLGWTLGWFGWLVGYVEQRLILGGHPSVRIK